MPILRQKNETEIVVHIDTDEYPGQHVSLLLFGFIYIFLYLPFHISFVSFDSQFATIQNDLDGSIYRGAQAEISIHNLTVQNNQYSKSQNLVGKRTS